MWRDIITETLTTWSSIGVCIVHHVLFFYRYPILWCQRSSRWGKGRAKERGKWRRKVCAKFSSKNTMHELRELCSVYCTTIACFPACVSNSTKYSASSVIWTSIIQTLVYPNSQKFVNFHEFHYNLQDGGHLVMWSVFQPPVCYLFSSH